MHDVCFWNVLLKWPFFIFGLKIVSQVVQMALSKDSCFRGDNRFALQHSSEQEETMNFIKEDQQIN